MLEKRDEAAGSRHANQLADETRPVAGRDVVEHADRECEVERLVGVRRHTPVERAIPDLRVPVCGGLDRLGNDVDAVEARKSLQVRMDQADAAADVERTNLVERAEVLPGEVEQGLRLRADEELVLTAGEGDRVGDVALVRLDMLVELRGYDASSSAARAMSGENPTVSLTR